MNTSNQVLLIHNSLTLSNAKALQKNRTNASNIAKFYIYTSTLLMALVFVISMMLAPVKEAYAGAVKWHPGHYYTLMSAGKNKSAYMDKVYSELKSTPALRGLQIRFLWAELETAENIYDFSAIDKHLNELATRKRRLVIQVQTKSFDPDWALVPDYLKAGIYEGGVFAFSSYGADNTIKGYNIKLWNDNVRNRLVKLFRKLGERYNSHPYFEGIGMIETALGQPINPITNDQVTSFYDNLLNVHQNMRDFFPNTMTIQEVNYPRPILESFVGTLQAMGTTLSSPDTRLDDPGLSSEGNPYSPDGIYSYYRKLSGTMPLAPSVMQKNYENTREDGTGYEPTVSELLTFARDNLNANYIFWTRHQDYYQKVLEMLNWSGQKSTPSGGLNPTCPTAYTSCIN